MRLVRSRNRRPLELNAFRLALLIACLGAAAATATRSDRPHEQLLLGAAALAAALLLLRRPRAARQDDPKTRTGRQNRAPWHRNADRVTALTQEIARQQQEASRLAATLERSAGESRDQISRLEQRVAQLEAAFDELALRQRSQQQEQLHRLRDAITVHTTAIVDLNEFLEMPTETR